MAKNLQQIVVLFDGKEGPEKWKMSGLNLKPGEVPDQYVKECSMGAVNLHIYQIGRYEGCNGCQKQKACQEYAGVVAEQAEI
jgi:hypothetical protein